MILTRSRLGVLHLIFRKFVPDLWPLIYSKISIPFNILRKNDRFVAKFRTQDQDWDWYTSFFRSSVPELWPLIYARISFPHKYLEIKLTYFHHIVYLHWYWQDLGWDCYKSFFTNMFQSYGPCFTPEFRYRSLSWEKMVRFSPNFINAL